MIAYSMYATLNEQRAEILKGLKKGGVFLVNSDVVLNKMSTIERCIIRIEEVYAKDPSNLSDFTKQDSII